MAFHEVLESSTLIGGVRCTDHMFTLPLTWGSVEIGNSSSEEFVSSSGTVNVFVRELSTRANAPTLLFLQGGPGFPCSRPTSPPVGWLKRALVDFRVLLMDQRGTGRSKLVTLPNGITVNILEGEGRGLVDRLAAAANNETNGKFSCSTEAGGGGKGISVEDERGGINNNNTEDYSMIAFSLADLLSNFRADSIVKDAEAIRLILLGTAKYTLLGQSFGGFCALTYLSLFPQSLDSVIFTCGLAPVGVHIDDVYRATYKRLERRNRLFYERYPNDGPKVRRIISFLSANPTRLPRGGILTPRRFLLLGLGLGYGGGMEMLHWLLEDAWSEVDRELNYSFLCQVESQQMVASHPIHWILHEAIYMDGEGGGGGGGGGGNGGDSSNNNNNNGGGRGGGVLASAWSAERVLKEFPVFDYEAAMREERLVYFLGEMMFSWMGEDFPALSPLLSTAHVLAQKTNWGPLYDQDVLRNTLVPCAALISSDDIYVERDFSEQTAEILGANCLTYLTNEYRHSAIRDDGGAVLDKLLNMLRNKISLAT